ncbi:MAG: C10 family peptidase [Bacteroidaceae bacterium]
MKKKLLFLTLVLLSLGPIWATPRDKSSLRAIAEAHFAKHSTKNTQKSIIQNEEKATLITSSKGLLGDKREDAFYIYGAEEGGFVILSADDRLPLVLGYAEEGTVNTNSIPDGLLDLLNSYQVMSEQLTTEDTINLSEKGINSSSTLPEKVAPLLERIRWSQDYPYYNSCPTISGNNTLVGCAATSMATIMRFYEYPNQGTGSSSYTWNGSTLNVDFSTHSYNWNLIRERYLYELQGDGVTTTDHFSSDEADEVAKLCYDVALSIQMSFGLDASSSTNTEKMVTKALTNNFNYDKNLQFFYRDYFSSAEWLNLLKEEVADGRPIYFRGGQNASNGHIMVIDGYDSSNLMHFDFGWGGTMNGYYYLAEVNPATSGSGITENPTDGYNLSQFAILGIQPPTASSSYRPHFITTSTLTTSSSSINEGSTFKLGATLLNRGTDFSGYYCAALLNKNGEITVLAQNTLSAAMSSSSNKKELTCTVPINLENGYYTLCFMARTTSNDEWSIVRSASTIAHTLDAEMVDGTLTVSTPSTNISLNNATITIPHALYNGLYGNYKLTLTNGDTNFMGTIGVGIKNGSVYSALASGYRTLDAEQTATFSLESNISISSGEYTLYPLYKSGSTWYPIGSQKLPISIKEQNSEGTISLTCTSASLPQNSIYGVNDSIKGSLTIQNSGTLPYNMPITMATYVIGTNAYNVAYNLFPIFIDAGESMTLDISSPHNLPEGSYGAYFYFYPTYNSMTNSTRLSPKESTRFNYSVNDSVLSTVGLRSLYVSGSKALIANIAENTNAIHVCCAEPLQRVLLFQINGTLLADKNNIDSTETDLSTEKMAKGIYVIQGFTTNEHCYTLKIIKK